MQATAWMKSALLVAAISLMGTQARAHQDAAAAQRADDAMVQAAKKAREAKKTAAKPKKVVTDDDVAHRAPEASATEEKSAAGEEQKADGDAKKEDPNSENAWRKKFADQRGKIAKAELELSVLQREVGKGQLEYYSDPQKALKEQNSREELKAKTAKIEEMTKEVARLKQELENMELEMKRAGGDPGWAR